MESQISKKIRLVSITLLVTGVISAAIVYALPQEKGARMRRARGFTIVTKETVTLIDQKMQSHPQQADYVITVRSQKSDGTWKEVKTAYKSDGRVIKEDMSFGIPGQGVFQADQARAVLNFVSPMPPKEVTSYVAITDGHDHLKFLRDDVVQGYKTYVLHYIVADDGSYEDEYYASELDGYPIKSVKVSPYGSSITEATQITLGDPEERMFSSLPKWFIKYDLFNEKIKAMEDDGKHETAGAMRRQLQQELKKQPKNP